jgi:hypothetical protein
MRSGVEDETLRDQILSEEELRFKIGSLMNVYIRDLMCVAIEDLRREVKTLKHEIKQLKK